MLNRVFFKVCEHPDVGDARRARACRALCLAFLYSRSNVPYFQWIFVREQLRVVPILQMILDGGLNAQRHPSVLMSVCKVRWERNVCHVTFHGRG